MISGLRKIILYWLPPIFWMGLVFFLSSFHKIQVTEVGWANFITRKLAHFSEYAVLYFLFYRGFKNTAKFSLKKVLFLSFILTILYALSDEYHQTWISGRTGKFFDIGVDCAGAFLGLIFSWRLVNLLPEKIKKIIL